MNFFATVWQMSVANECGSVAVTLLIMSTRHLRLNLTRWIHTLLTESRHILLGTETCGKLHFKALEPKILKYLSSAEL